MDVGPAVGSGVGSFVGVDVGGGVGSPRHSHFIGELVGCI